MLKPQKGRNLIRHEGIVLCKLYNTVVADIRDTIDGKVEFTVRTGGFHTMSTVKAINAALEEARLGSRARAYRKQFIVHVEVDGIEYEVDEPRTIILD